LECPISAFGGLEDHRVPPESVSAWRVQTRGAFAQATYPAGHLFHQSARDALLRDITRTLDVIGRPAGS
jgi:medium-chain acyl-[acyl-carrier-protein] hydrolase